MFIPDNTIDQVRAATDIVDIIRDHVELKRQGTRYVGLCPFHQEKTPSFSVNPALGIFKCFGCGKGGDVFRFLMEMDATTFPEAVRTLAKKANIPLPEHETGTRDAREVETIHATLRFAARFFHDNLTSSSAAKGARTYLNNRGFSPQTLRSFGLGYAPGEWNGLLRKAKAAHITPHALEQAGLVVSKKNKEGFYDRFRDRIIFPIFSLSGTVIGFGGRIMQEKPASPKYINSPETKVYHKSQALYGLYQGKKAIRDAKEVILVEGYTDVLSLHQAEIQNVVASSGTALTQEQIRILGRFAKRVLLLYDADEAGGQAALRGIDMVLSQGLSAYAVTLPQGSDPDSYVQEKGADAFRAYLEEYKQNFIDFIYAGAQRREDLNTPEGRTETIRSVLKALAHIPDRLQLDSFLLHASGIFREPLDTLRKALSNIQKQQQSMLHRREPSREPPPLHEPQSPSIQPPEKVLLRLMLTHGPPIIRFIMRSVTLEDFTEGHLRDIVRTLFQMRNQEEVNVQHFFSDPTPPGIQQLIAGVLSVRNEPSKNWATKNIHVPTMDEKPEQTATSALKRLKLIRINKRIDEKQKMMYGAENSAALQAEIMKLLKERRDIEAGTFLHSGT